MASIFFLMSETKPFPSYKTEMFCLQIQTIHFFMMYQSEPKQSIQLHRIIRNEFQFIWS